MKLILRYFLIIVSLPLFILAIVFALGATFCAAGADFFIGALEDLKKEFYEKI